MPCLWQPTSCSVKGFVVIPSSSFMDANAATLSSLTVFVWLGGNMPTVSAAALADTIHAQTNVKKVLFKVVPHYPEEFLVTFKFVHHRDMLTSTGRFLHGEIDLHTTNWNVLHRGRHLYLEEVTLQALDEEIVGMIIGKACVHHYFDIAMVRKEDVSTLHLWARTTNPSDIPKPDVEPTLVFFSEEGASACINDVGLRTRQCLPSTLVQPLLAAPARVLLAAPCPITLLVGDVLRVAPAPLRHDLLILLGDEEAALPRSVLRTVLCGVYTRRRGDV
ncbi:hypothetical protein D1007_10056 [Hordeum vulgare]|nr:hypothetical protein D1007_10056 [Hordeum vulgare]